MIGSTEKSARRTGRRILGVVSAGLVIALAGCATAPKVEPFRPVWPAPPLPARIEFIRSLTSDEDMRKDTTFSDKLEEMIGGKKPAANHIAEPMGIAVSDDGQRVYISDYGQLAVFIFDFGKNVVTKIGADTPLAQPVGIALDGAENLYVVEQEKKGITVFGRDGKPLRFFTDPSLERPEGIAIDRPRGKIYVADTAHTKSTIHNVKIFDMEGKLIGTLGTSKGSKPGEFLFPTYVTLDPQGNVYVTDTLNSRVQEFDTDGKYVKSFGQRGNGWGMFDKPKGAALDSFGNVYVVDSGWSNVQIFNQKGEILLFFGGNGRNPGLLWAPTAIAIDKHDQIYVADNLNHRVEMYKLVNTSKADSYLALPDDPKSGKNPDKNPDKSAAEQKPEAKK
jgi:DNA-binding beta-propeller fold protein YncE